MDCERGVKVFQEGRRAPVTGQRAFFRGLSPSVLAAHVANRDAKVSVRPTGADHDAAAPRPCRLRIVVERDGESPTWIAALARSAS